MSSTFSSTDTIVAIATPPGRGGIGVVRLSGHASLDVASRFITHAEPLTPRRATFTRVRAPQVSSPDQPAPAPPSIDEVVVTFFQGPASYTGEDVVEVSAHGSPVVLRAIVEAALVSGARLAEPGEFTLRAFLNGRLDLPQAEAVSDLINAVTPLQARAAFDQLQGTLTGAIGELDAELFHLVAGLEASIDFPEEGYHFLHPDALIDALQTILARTDALLASGRRGRLIREGLHIAIVGKPNVGKSSLFNALVGTSRAIVTDVPGTTRDLVTEAVDIEGLQVTLVDTAGLREAQDPVEAEGINRTRQAQSVADLLLVVVDGSAPLDEIDADIINQTIDNKRLIVSNKSDLAQHPPISGAVAVSATRLDGFPELRTAILGALDVDLLADTPDITNLRHLRLLEQARGAMIRAKESLVLAGGTLSEEFVLADLQEARIALEEIAGRRTSEELLHHIFSKFCIGK